MDREPIPDPFIKLDPLQTLRAIADGKSATIRELAIAVLAALEDMEDRLSKYVAGGHG